jgi:RNA polymerase sigma factor (TIGR02999 family)
MSDVTLILSRIEEGDGKAAAEQLLPLVYDELRRLAAQKLAHEKPGYVPQATSLVHEAYLRLVDVDQAQHFSSRGHFFAAAAEAMRRILVERARRRCTEHRVLEAVREGLRESESAVPGGLEQLLAIHDVLDKLAAIDRSAADLVKLRYFVGLTMVEAADVLGISVRTAHQLWTYARSWLHHALSHD